jgi:hypothetical protein
VDCLVARILAVVIVNAGIAGVGFLARRFTAVSNRGISGIYPILLPVGFQCFGWDVPPLFVLAFVLLGLSILLSSMRRVELKSGEPNGLPG